MDSRISRKLGKSVSRKYQKGLQIAFRGPLIRTLLIFVETLISVINLCKVLYSFIVEPQDHESLTYLENKYKSNVNIKVARTNYTYLVNSTMTIHTASSRDTEILVSVNCILLLLLVELIAT